MGNKTLSYNINIKLYTNYTQLVGTRCGDNWKKSRLIGKPGIKTCINTGWNTMYIRFEVYNCTKSMGRETWSYKVDVKLYTNYTQLVGTRCGDNWKNHH